MIWCAWELLLLQLHSLRAMCGCFHCSHDLLCILCFLFVQGGMGWVNHF